MKRGVEHPERITPDDSRWPGGLGRLGADAPGSLNVIGNVALLADDALGLFCSVQAPGRVVIETYDIARSLGERGGTVVGGFQSPLEREVLDYLLRGSACAIVCPARSLHRMRLRLRWRMAAQEGRLLLLSPFAETVRRPTAQSAEFRNRVAAALSSRLLFLHATPGGRLSRLAVEACSWRTPLHCLDHPSNDDLRLIGAIPVRSHQGPGT